MAEYKVICTLHEQSGFGWDEGDQRVTVLLSVWEAYNKGFFFLLCILFETKLTLMIHQSHEKAKKYMNKPFPLYDNLVALCNAVIETGVGAFRGTCHGSSDHDAEGSEDDENRVDWLASEEKGLDWFDNLVHKFTL